MIVGVGTDIIEVSRLATALARTPHLADRLFTDAERGLSLERLAARFAAKEAVAKALGRPAGARWRDAEVHSAPDGRPHLLVHGYEHLTWHVSLAHDGGMATAFVIAEDRGGTHREDSAPTPGRAASAAPAAGGLPTAAEEA